MADALQVTVWSGHRCGAVGCEGLATFGFKIVADAPQGRGYAWACGAHRERAEAAFRAARGIGDDGAPTSPLRSRRPFKVRCCKVDCA